MFLSRIRPILISHPSAWSGHRLLRRFYKVDGSALRQGFVIEHEGKLCAVTKVQHITPGRRAAIVNVEMKDLKTGTKHVHRFRAEESVEKVHLDERKLQFLYATDSEIVLMDPSSFEQLQAPVDIVDPQVIPFLQSESEVHVEFYDTKPVTLTPPEDAVCLVESTDPVMKGATVTNSYKPAVLDNGVRVSVPPFVETGDRIVVRLSDLTYVSRVK